MSRTRKPRPATRYYLVTWFLASERTQPLRTRTDGVHASTAKRAERRVRKDHALGQAGDFRCHEVLVIA